MKITIPYKPISWNVLARQNHWKYTKMFNEMKQMTWYAIRAGKKEVFTSPVHIYVHARWKQKRRHDIDSLCFKPILDQIVADGILKDDSIEYVKSVTYTGETGADKDEIIVTIIL